MARTPSNMLPLGTKLPEFRLISTEQTYIASRDFVEKPLLVMFICNHCPFVIHIKSELVKLGKDYLSKGLSIVAINSNDAVAFPADNFENMKKEKLDVGYSFPYLYDETQTVAKSFDAACTPEFYLFDKSHKLVYRGQLDDSRPSNQVPVTGKDLRRAIDQLLSGTQIDNEQKPSLGCNIKWK